MDPTDPAMRARLRELAWAAVEAAASGRPMPAVHAELATLPPQALFVSLHAADGALRGCLGTFAADAPLSELLVRMASRAATEDPRFPPVAPHELLGLTLEISLLGPMRPLGGPDELLVGRDGLKIRGRGALGLLLPQVAADRGWSAEEFLARCCRKAGLPALSWRDRDVTVERFGAEVF